jgi:hypothetical protein
MTVSIVSYIALFVDRKFAIVTLLLPPPPPPLLRNFLNQIESSYYHFSVLKPLNYDRLRQFIHEAGLLSPGSATISRQFQKIYKFLSQSEIVTKQFFYFFSNSEKL